MLDYLREEGMELKIQAEERSKTYMLLSLFFLKKPDKSFLWKLNQKQFIANLADIIARGEGEISKGFGLIKSFIDSHKDIGEEEVLEKMEVDFTKLTRGIRKGYGPPPPYESVWKGENIVMGEATQEVIRFYTKTGIGMDLKGEIPDHIGIELKFMSLLCYKEKENWEKEEYELVFGWLLLEKDFIENHLLDWTPFYLNEMESQAETDFYKGVSIITKNFLELDKETIDELLKLRRESS